jgi:CRP/FNR family transcriptional regulator, cyclic AMP receptor protein
LAKSFSIHTQGEKETHFAMTTTVDLFRNTTDYVLYEAGQVIFEEGQPGDTMYAIIEGEVEITVNGQPIDLVGPGGIVGEMALVDASPRSGTARAKTQAKLVPINQKRFTFLVQQTPFFALQVMSIMAERLRRFMLSA